MACAIEKLGKIGIMPVIKPASPEQALSLGRALIEGSLTVAEVPFRTDAAGESIKILSKELPDLIVGAGAVLTTEQVSEAVKAGAKYIVTHGFNPKVVKYCIDKKIPITPGVSSPSQVEEAIEMGLKVVSFFPAESAGGVDMLKALAGPYGSKVSFIPAGGVNEKNLVGYLSQPNVHAVGGSWMAPGKLIDGGDFASIANLCRNARMQSLGFEMRHIGLNPAEGDKVFDDSKFFAELLGMTLREAEKSFFVGVGFEVMKAKGRGRDGHIAISTLSIERALEWFEGYGIKPIDETKRTKDGFIEFIYIDKPFLGFSIHLSRVTK